MATVTLELTELEEMKAALEEEKEHYRALYLNLKRAVENNLTAIEFDGVSTVFDDLIQRLQAEGFTYATGKLQETTE